MVQHMKRMGYVFFVLLKERVQTIYNGSMILELTFHLNLQFELFFTVKII